MLTYRTLAGGAVGEQDIPRVHNPAYRIVQRGAVLVAGVRWQLLADAAE